MSSEKTAPEGTRRTDEQVIAQLQRKLQKVEQRQSVENRRRRTLEKILLGAGVLRLADPVLAFRCEEALSDRDRERLRDLRRQR